MDTQQRPVFEFDILLKRLGDRYGSEERAYESFRNFIWPTGFRCRQCAGRFCRHIRTRNLYVCMSCRRQHSLTAGTPMHGSSIPLQTWAIIFFLGSRPESKGELLDYAPKLGVSERQLRRIRTKLFGRSHTLERSFVARFMWDLQRGERTSNRDT